PYQHGAMAGYLHQFYDSNLTVQELEAEDEAEVLNFLAQRPSHTFGLRGFIRTNGIVSPLNRGTFYAYRNDAGQLEGVALIAHHILFETLNDVAIKAFAEAAQNCKEAFVLLAERDKAQ